MGPPAVPRYAILFKIFFWDDFIARRLAALLERRVVGEVWVVVDDTHGFVSGVTHDRVFRTREDDIIRLGLPDEPHGNLHWYNADYQLLAFSRAHADYAYYVMMEHDAAMPRALDAMLERVGGGGVDLVAHPLSDPVREWPWTPSLLEFWPVEKILNQLLAISVFSRRAVAYLWERRLAHAVDFARGTIREWPYCEGYVPTLLHEAGFSLAPLSDFGDTSRHDWWPPHHESELAAIPDGAFAHPVLAGKRYVASMLRFPPPETWLQDGSFLRAKLDRETPATVVPALVEAFMRRGDIPALVALRQAVADLGWHDCAFALEPLIDPARVAGETRPFAGVTHSVSTTRDQETPPETGCAWHMADLGRACWIREIRLRGPAGPLAFSVWHSANGRGWSLLARRESGTDGQPLVLAVPDGLLARFLRIEWEGPADPAPYALDIAGVVPDEE